MFFNLPFNVSADGCFSSFFNCIWKISLGLSVKTGATGKHRALRSGNFRVEALSGILLAVPLS